MKPALLIVDMLKDTFEGHSETELVQAARNFLPRLNEWLDWFHEQKLPVVFACDSFLADDFIFRGRMEPHSLRGTRGAEVISELHREPHDIILRSGASARFLRPISTRPCVPGGGYGADCRHSHPCMCSGHGA